MEVEMFLSQEMNGTFILRFSDTVLGGVSIAYVGAEMKVLMVAPFSNTELDKRSIADIVMDLKNLLTQVYSKPTPVSLNIFRKYRPILEEKVQEKPGYLSHTLVAKVQNIKPYENPGYIDRVLEESNI